MIALYGNVCVRNKVSKEHQLPLFYKLGHLTIHFPSALKHFCEVVLCLTCQCWEACAVGAAWRIQKLKSTCCLHCSFVRF